MVDWSTYHLETWWWQGILNDLESPYLYTWRSQRSKALYLSPSSPTARPGPQGDDPPWVTERDAADPPPKRVTKSLKKKHKGCIKSQCPQKNQRKSIKHHGDLDGIPDLEQIPCFLMVLGLMPCRPQVEPGRHWTCFLVGEVTYLFSMPMRLWGFKHETCWRHLMLYDQSKTLIEQTCFFVNKYELFVGSKYGYHN